MVSWVTRGTVIVVLALSHLTVVKIQIERGVTAEHWAQVDNLHYHLLPLSFGLGGYVHCGCRIMEHLKQGEIPLSTKYQIEERKGIQLSIRIVLVAGSRTRRMVGTGMVTEDISCCRQYSVGKVTWLLTGQLVLTSFMYNSVDMDFWRSVSLFFG